ncbi:MAG: glycosyltransferase family 4 protein [Bryobacterales bacterium]|nr:glycosyltransferase family 4 protein [Bryobacterales bacterium]MBV9397680.1 glycosyltransferase family 4 protein [Bryobacterales bacterium]
MKILYHHRTRATDAQKVHILEMVAAFRGLGHEVTIASLVETENRTSEPEREAQESGFKKLFRRIPFSSELIQLGYNLFAIPWLCSKIRSSGANFIYERYSLLNFSGVAASALMRKPIIVEVNSPLALEMSRDKEIRARKFAAWMERVICNSATRVVVVSGPLRRIMMENGVHETKLYLMPNGVNLHRFVSKPDSALANRLGIRDRVAIGFVGWFRRWHGLEFLLEAFHQSGLGKDRAVLMLIGDGPATPELRDYVAKVGLGNAVIFTGAVSHEDIPAYLNLVEIAVQPAANEYCCPMKIIEYMGLGKAIVAPRQENIEELLDNGRTAVLFKPGDTEGFARALTALVLDSSLRARVGQGALRAIHDRGLLWEANAQRVVDILQPGGKVLVYD